MPIYEYKCKSCDQVFEQLVFSSRDESNLNCPACGSVDVERQMSCFSSGQSASGGITRSAGGCAPSSGFS